ncbi:MAG: WD40 repeat domain-containing protein [Gemmataceae bacterium]
MSHAKLSFIAIWFLCCVGLADNAAAQTPLPKGAILRIGPGNETKPPGGYIVTFSENGKQILTGSERLVICDAFTGKRLRELPAVFDDTNLGGSSTHGHFIGTYNTDGTLEVWQTQTGKRLETFKRKTERHPCHLAIDGSTVAFVKDFTVHLLETKTSNLLHKWQLPKERALFSWRTQYGEAQLRFSPTGQSIVTMQYFVLGRRTGMGLKVRTWDTKSGTLWSTVVLQDLKQVLHPWPCVVSPDDRLLCLATPDLKLAVYEIVSGQLLAEFDTQRASALRWPEAAFSPDGRCFAYYGEDDNIRVVDLATRKILNVFTGHETWVTSLAFSPDGKRLASADTNDTTYVWQLSKPKPQTQSVPPKELNRLWIVLSSRDPKAGYRAVTKLGHLPTQAVALIQNRLKKTDSSPEVIEQLIRDLDSKSFRTRTRAEKKLVYLGSTVEKTLRTHIQKNIPLETRLRIERILPKLKGLPPEVLQQLRATAVLEAIGTKKARAILQEMAQTPLSLLSQKMAQCALTRLENRKQQ